MFLFCFVRSLASQIVRRRHPANLPDLESLPVDPLY
jgi:hypothetical protein